MVKFLKTKSLLRKYSTDRSIYTILPRAIVFPTSEKDVQEIVAYARKNKVSITPRGGGTGLSGAGIGSGIMIDFSKYLHKITKIGAITRVESGVLLKKLRPLVEKAGYMLPSVPLHDKCAIGGNVNTCSVGPRTVKYGTLHNQVTSIRGVLANGKILDTKKKLPEDVERKISSLRKHILKDKKFIQFLKKRPLVAGGYYLKAFIENKDSNDIVTQLVVGSVGTLVLLTEVELRLPKFKELHDLYLAHFKTFDELQKSLNEVLKQGAASVEYADKDSLVLWHKKYQHHDAIGVMIIGFEAQKRLGKITKKCALVWKRIPKQERKHLWTSRMLALPKLEKQAKNEGLSLPSGIDDTTFHPKDFAKIMNAVKKYSEQHKIKIASFGHIGVGSLHLRPFMKLKEHPKQFDRLGKDIFTLVHTFGGTLVGEHNAGLCRSRYLAMESKKLYAYMKKVKEIFDPDNLLNPKVMFNLAPVTKHIKK